ncbi:hypothetical protein WN55_04485, partial [Dufourea novaeangliae]
TVERRVKIVKTFYQNDSSIRVILCKLLQDFDGNNVPKINKIRTFKTKFKQCGYVKDMPRSGRVRIIRTSENIEKVRGSLTQNPETSRHRSQEVNIRRTTSSTISILTPNC